MIFLRIHLFVFVSMIGQSALAQDISRPNVLVIMADDCTHTDLPLYGGENAVTPNIDRLAAQGMTFRRAYVSMAMCQPCRSALFTGRYPLRNGCTWNHSASRPETTSIAQHLGTLGYRVGLAGKKHVRPDKSFPFENVRGFDPNCVRSPTRAHSTESVAEFMSRDNEQPFCLVIALVEPHVPWVMGDASKYPPDEIKLPPYLADTTVTRDAFSRYLAEITYMDGQVGEILETLKSTGREDDTLVLFTSEQGSQFPGCKWTNWDNGLHTALIARLAGVVAPGSNTDAIVQYEDVAPTLVELAGGDPKRFGYDGSSFLATLRDGDTPHRQFAYGMHNNVPEGPAYPIRTISNGEYRLIHNLTPDDIYIEKHLMGMRGDGKLNNPYWATWVFDTENSARSERLVKRYMKRPKVELYHTSSDPFELTNLAGNPKYESIQADLSRELDAWMTSQGDPGIPLDTKRALEAARKGRHEF